MKEKVPFWSLKVRLSVMLPTIITAVLMYGLMCIFQPCLIEGYSMYPWIQTGDVVILNRLDRTPERGQAVNVTSPIDGKGLLKRAIGLPGDIIVMINGRAYVFNDTYVDLNKHVLFDEPPNNSRRVRKIYVVPEGHIFVLGDNRANSTDSRVFGFVPLENVQGVVLGRIWR